ncbi:hybrid signal transduction histidine kinase M [Tanacetum coccineum]
MISTNPASAKAAWDTIETIFQENKRTRTVALKGELRVIQMGDDTPDAYFSKIDSIITLLTDLGSTMDDDDIVTYAINGLSEKYGSLAQIIAHKDPFPDLATVRTMVKVTRNEYVSWMRRNVGCRRGPAGAIETATWAGVVALLKLSWRAIWPLSPIVLLCELLLTTGEMVKPTVHRGFDGVQAALAEAGCVIILFPKRWRKGKKIHDLTMESAVIALSSVGDQIERRTIDVV